MIGRTVSHYEILSLIGGGGMGQVYKARDTRLNVHRALKFIHPHLVTDKEFKARFIREAQAASSLDHPNICSIHEVDETPNGMPFICMTFYEGVSLAERVKAAPLPLAEVLQIGFAVGLGLACAHRHGILHRDIKPGNILITTDGFVKIVDFGLAKLVGRTDLTTDARSLGTASYMSPEQVNGPEVDHRTDIWSLGVILFEMAGGRPPFGGDHDLAVLYSVLHEEPPDLKELAPDLPESFVRLVVRCLEKDRDRRYPSLEELLADLAEVAREGGLESSVLARTAVSINSNCLPAPVRRRRRARIAFAATAGVLAAAVLTVWWFGRPPPLYTTKLRVAVMPLENLAHPALDDMAAGLTVVAGDLLDELAGEHGSLWVVPDRLVIFAELGEIGRARDTFGINRLVTGSLQRHADGHLLQLMLRDADSTERLKTVSFAFDADNPIALADSLPRAIARLIDLDPARSDDLRRALPADGPDVGRFLGAAGARRVKEPGRAVPLLRDVAATEPLFAAGLCALGRACAEEYLVEGREALLDSALTFLAAAANLAPKDWRPIYERGEILRRLGRAEPAIAAFETAAGLKPGYPLICDRLARVYRDGDRRGEAESALLGAIERRPDYFEVHRLLGNHYRQTGETEAAIRQLRAAVALAPDDSYTRQLLGATHQSRGEIPLARGHFERAFQLVPNFENCSNVGLMLYYEDKFADAARYYELAKDFPEGAADYETWGNLAIALHYTPERRSESVEKFRKALELGEQALAGAPGDTKLIGCLIEYNAMSGNDDAARALVARYDSLAAGDPRLLYKIGDAYEILGDRSAALRYLTESLRQGYPLQDILETRELSDLIADPIFRKIIEEKEAVAGTTG